MMRSTATTKDLPVTPAQVKAIHVLKAKVAMTDEDYEAMLSGYRCKSSLQLTRYEASELISRLIKLTNGKTRAFSETKTVRMPTNVTRLATLQQMKTIKYLADRVKWKAGEDGFALWIRKQFGLQRIATTVDASKVIRGLNVLIQNGHAL